MIHIITDYYVSVEDNNYTVMKKKMAMRKNPDTGVQEETDTYKPVAYLGSMRTAIENIGKLYRRDKLQEAGDIDLTEAIKILQMADKDMKSVLYRAIGEN